MRVVLTLDDLAELLRLPQGHRLEAVAETPDGTRPGVLVTIGGDLKGISHTRYEPGEPIRIIRLREYRERSETVIRDPGPIEADRWRAATRARPFFQGEPERIGGYEMTSPIGDGPLRLVPRGTEDPDANVGIPYGEMVAAGNAAYRAPPPPVPPGMTPPVTQSDPPPHRPARAPVGGSDPEGWPKFPGEELLPQSHGDDPGDETIHTGGPR